MFYYIWLHLQFVREHEDALVTGQRVQQMLSQIKPHLLHNALTLIVDLCDTAPQKARNRPQDPSRRKQAKRRQTIGGSKGNKCTVTFDGGGADGEMEPVQVRRGKLYKLPECEYSIEGGVFDAWMVSSSDGSDPVAYQPGEAIKVTGDMTVTASWLFDDSAMEFGAGEIEYGGESDANAVANDNGTGLSVETEDASTGAEGLTLSGEPSEAGSVFNSAGIAAIIAAAVLVLVGAVIVIVKKKKK